MTSLKELDRQYRIGYRIRKDSITDRLDLIFQVLIEILREIRDVEEQSK